MRLSYAPYILKFKNPAGTSRGVLLNKPTYILKIWDENNPEIFGLGEASVFPGLSPEANGRYEYKIVELLSNIALGRPTDLAHYSSLQLGLEQAIRDYVGGGKGIYFPSSFTEGEKEITINGLVWMGSFEEMLDRVEEKVLEGFHCIKLKIGAIDWEKEKALIEGLRLRFSKNELMIRVDANGGFSPENVMSRLDFLANLDVHSIEQPLKKGLLNETAEICKVSPIPIALDEELIGICTTEERQSLLDIINPQYIILKPSLCGAFSGTSEWIHLADQRNIGWWITSALESNIGLNAIAQFTASIKAEGPQGLGTGGLYTNNFSSPLSLSGENMKFNPSFIRNRPELNNLDWRE